MEHGIGTRQASRGVAGERMRTLARGLLAAALAACHAPASPGTAPELADPTVFATWPRVTEEPIPVSRQLSLMCAIHPAAGHMEAVLDGPPADHSIVVRVSPEAIAAYRQGRPLPAGAVVVKEKYDDASASGPLRAYGVMIKRAAGYDRRGGDWEYGYVTLAATPVVARGRLAECAGCHASARGSDYLFRSHVNPGREARGR